LRDYRADFEVSVVGLCGVAYGEFGSKYRWKHNGHVFIIGGRWR